ncbi:MAG: hypothetical protein ACOYT4_02910 [Nanoarchaeota archaeon]
MSSLIISDKKKYNELKRIFKEQGYGKIHVVSDFDKTLTKAYVNGNKIPGIIAQIRDGTYLSKDYAEKAHALFNKYHPLEISSTIPEEEKKQAMFQWWTEHFELLIKSGLNKKDLERVVKEGPAEFREGVSEFLDFLNINKIPLIILSSSGLGNYIPMYLEKYNKNYDNINVISNLFEFDKQGYATKIKQPIIHALNKDEQAFRNFPIYKSIQKKKNVILLGDGIEDLKMISGFKFDNLIKFGFLNEDIESNLDLYKQNFDVLITNDGNFEAINKFFEEIG